MTLSFVLRDRTIVVGWCDRIEKVTEQDGSKLTRVKSFPRFLEGAKQGSWGHAAKGVVLLNG